MEVGGPYSQTPLNYANPHLSLISDHAPSSRLLQWERSEG